MAQSKIEKNVLKPGHLQLANVVIWNYRDMGMDNNMLAMYCYIRSRKENKPVKANDIAENIGLALGTIRAMTRKFRNMRSSVGVPLVIITELDGVKQHHYTEGLIFNFANMEQESLKLYQQKKGLITLTQKQVPFVPQKLTLAQMARRKKKTELQEVSNG